MGSNLDTAINELKQSFLNISASVIENVKISSDILINKDGKEINVVRENDREIDKKEILLEESCIQIIAMYQPKGQTLRFLIAMIKVNNDLERISDLAVNMAKSVKTLSQYKSDELFLLNDMVTKVISMLENSIDALLNLDSKKAMHICGLDEEIDLLKHKQREMIMQVMQKNPSLSEYYLDIIINGRRLERIADLCTNIAEDVIYIKEGEIIRHRKWDK
jgi:phosphate transport system protein